LVTGEDREFTTKEGTSGAELRSVLVTNGYKKREYVNLGTMATVATRTGDVLIIEEMHSGVFTGPDSISHFLGDTEASARELTWTVREMTDYKRTYNPADYTTITNPVARFSGKRIELWRKGSRPPPAAKCEAVVLMTPAPPYRVSDHVTFRITVTTDNHDVIDDVSVRPEFYATVQNISADKVRDGVWEAKFVTEVPSTNPPFVDYDLSGTSDDGTLVKCGGREPYEVVADKLEIKLEGPKETRIGEDAQYTVRMVGGAPPFRINWDLDGEPRLTSFRTGRYDMEGEVWSDTEKIVWNTTGRKNIVVNVSSALTGPSDPGGRRMASITTVVHPKELLLEVDGPRQVVTGQRAEWVLRTRAVGEAERFNKHRRGYDFSVNWDTDDHSWYRDRAENCTVSHVFSRPGELEIPVMVSDTHTGLTGETKLRLKVEDGKANLLLKIEGPVKVSPDDSPEWTFSIGSGKKPYELVVNWGDSIEERLPRLDNDLTLGHAYQPGRGYLLRAMAEDSRGNVSDWITLPIAVGLPADTLRFERADVSAGEDRSTVEVVVVREGSGQGEATVTIRTGDASAEAGKDYNEKRETLKWPEWNTGPIPVSIDILDDNDVEGDEEFRVELSDPKGAILGSPHRLSVKIADNDTPSQVPVQRAVFEPREYRIGESGGSVRVVVKRIGGNTGILRVDFATQDAYAKEGNDYQPSSGTFEWLDGDTTDREFRVTILTDEEVEREETIHLQLSNPRNDTVPVIMDEGVEALILITDDDAVEPEQEPNPGPRRCEALLITADAGVLRPGQTARLTVTAVFSDGARENVTGSPLLTWRDGRGPVVSAPLELRFSERIEAAADYNNGECFGRTTVRMEPPSWQPPISDAGDIGARVPTPPPDAYSWYVVCNTATDACAVNYTEHVDVTRHIVMSEALPGPRNAALWIDERCPTGRCGPRGECATEPVRGGDWRVLCNTRTGEMTLARENPLDFDRRVIEGGFCGEPDARWWLENNCPGWRCDSSGSCADGPASATSGADGWYVVCYLPTGDVEIGKRPFDLGSQREMAGPFLGEPDARQWTEQSCPSWLCGASGCRLADGGDAWAPARDDGDSSGGGFVEHGQSDGIAENQGGEFVELGSDEALALLSDAQRAFIESQVRGRGFGTQSIRAISEEIAANLRQQSGQPDPNEGIDEIFQELVETAVWIATGERPPDLGGGAVGGGTGFPSGGTGGVGGGAGSGGGPGWDACVKKFCPHCGDSLAIMGKSPDRQCQSCKAREKRNIDDCVKGGAAADRPDAEIRSFRNHRMELCWTERWDADHGVSRKSYSCHCVGPDRPRPGGKNGCEPFARGEAYTLVECEFELNNCTAVANQMNFVESQKRGN